MKHTFYQLVFFIGLGLCLIFQAHSYEKADAFIVKVLDKRVKVLSPSKWDPKLHLIVKNETLTKLIGKVETEDGRLVARVSVESRKSQSIELRFPKSTKLFFVPMMPPFQKVQLKLGNKPYEIPPKEKN